MSATDDIRRASCRSTVRSGFLAARLFNHYKVGYYVGSRCPWAASRLAPGLARGHYLAAFQAGYTLRLRGRNSRALTPCI